VAVITYKDGIVHKVGCDCVERILSGDNSLISLFRKNIKLLAKLKSHLEILSRPVDQMPTAREYYGSGIYIISDDDGKDICVGDVNNPRSSGCILFHPNVNLERNATSRYPIDGRAMYRIKGGKDVWVNHTIENHIDETIENIEEGRKWLAMRISQIEAFLARVVAKGMATPAVK
jgi:hypothetical protein